MDKSQQASELSNARGMFFLTESLENGKQDVKDPEILEKALLWGQLILAKEQLWTRHMFQGHD